VKEVTILCANIRRVRLTRGWSQEATAERAGLGPRHFQDIESGRRPGIRLETIAKIAKVLKVEPWELLKPERFPEPAVQRGKSGRRIKR
jgi:transcriptional regulator with XRE-family HTH domain